MTDSQLDDAAINVYAALRHLTLAQVAAVSHLTVGDVVQHALQMRFVDPEAAQVERAVGDDPDAPKPSAHAGMPLDDFDAMVLGVIQAAEGWVGMGAIQADKSLEGVNMQRTRRAINRLIESNRVRGKGKSRARVYMAA